jgi:hypothetical protein
LQQWYTLSLLPVLESELCRNVYNNIADFTPPSSSAKDSIIWSYFGWKNKQHFSMHTRSMLNENNKCVIVRNQTYHTAILIIKLLKKLGEFSAVHLSLSSTDPTTVIAYDLEPSPNESKVNDELEASSLTYVRVFGDQYPILQKTASDLGLPPPEEIMRIMIEGGDIQALVTAENSNFIEQLFYRIIGQNKTTPAKLGVRTGLPKISYTNNMKSEKGEDLPWCSICMDDFVEGDEISYLSCGHYFHRGFQVNYDTLSFNQTK